MENQIDSGLVRTNSELNSVVTKWQKTEKNWNKGPGYIFHKFFDKQIFILKFSRKGYNTLIHNLCSDFAVHFCHSSFSFCLPYDKILVFKNVSSHKCFRKSK